MLTSKEWAELRAQANTLETTLIVGKSGITDALVAESIHLAEEYKFLAEKLNIPFVDTHLWNIELTFDGVHFTEEGHHAFAENLRKELCL